MYRRLSRKREIFRRVLVYTLMSLTVITTASLIILFTLGYRFNMDEGRLQQGSLVQFGSTPSGATVTIDGNAISSRTPSKSSVLPGVHEFTIWRDGYETWQKTINIKAGTLTWLNYALLVPKELTLETVAQYNELYASLAAPEGREILLQRQATAPSFELVDVRSDTIKSETLTIPSTIYSAAPNPNSLHDFSMVAWDEAGRYVLVQHTYGENKEWLALDTRDVSSTRNLTELFKLNISDVQFAGSGGSQFYALVDGNIRRLEVPGANVSDPLVRNVSSFDVYEAGNAVTYIGKDESGASRVVGIYQEGDDNSYVVRSLENDSDTPFLITTTRYFNENYTAISTGNKVEILSGSYPNSKEDVSDLKTFASFNLDRDVRYLQFSPDGQYLLAQSEEYFASYDLEYQSLASSTIEGEGQTAVLQWLDDNYIWSDRGGNLTIREFDGMNKHDINQVAGRHTVLLTNNGRYLYSIGTTDDGYRLQRVRMILR